MSRANGTLLPGAPPAGAEARTTSVPSAEPLTAAQRRCVEPLVLGWSTVRIARHLKLSPEGVTSQLKAVRRALGLSGTTRPVLVHALLERGLVAPPVCDRPAPGFTADDRTLLSALSQHAHYSSVAEAAGIPVDIVSTEITDLVAKAAADNATHLVALAHRWQLLGHGHGLPRAKDRRDAEAEAARGRLVVSVVTCVLAVISVILAASVRPFA